MHVEGKNLREYAGHVKYFGVEISEIRHDEYKDGLYDANLVCKSRYETRSEAPENPDYRTSDCHYEKRGETR